MSKRNGATKKSKKAAKVVRIDAFQVADKLGVYVSTIYRMRHAGKLPEPRVINGKMFWTSKAIAKVAA